MLVIRFWVFPLIPVLIIAALAFLGDRAIEYSLIQREATLAGYHFIPSNSAGACAAGLPATKIQTQKSRCSFDGNRRPCSAAVDREAFWCEFLCDRIDCNNIKLMSF
jgi:hypothetical protein